MSLIHVADVQFRYPPPTLNGQPIEALRGVDLEVDLGEFVVVMGPVGAGKSTLCLALTGAIPHAVDGDLKGQITVGGQDTREVPMGQLSLQVGFVLENAEAQLFNATVADEIAFGLEAMAFPPAEIEHRIDEVLALVDLAGFRQRSPRTLSGGEQKRLAIASVLAMQPRILVLDEPTVGLDARGRYNVLAAIDRLCQAHDRDTTVVMTTQDAESVAHIADRVVVLRDGRVSLTGTPREVWSQVEQMDRWGLDVPQLSRLAHRLHLPVAFRPEEAAQKWKHATAVEPAQPRMSSSHLHTAKPSTSPVIEIRDLSYDYPTSAYAALRGITSDILSGEWLAVIGINGSGKSTLVKHLNGLLHPTAGMVHVLGKDTRACQVGELAHTVSYLPQNPDQSIFSASVYKEVAYGPRHLGLRGQVLDSRVRETLSRLHLTPFAQHPPAVLGYGLRRQVALAGVLAMNAPVLILDEPAAGLDRGAIAQLMGVISERHQQGTTVVMVSHDLRIVAQYAQRVIALHQGRLAAQGTPQQVLSDVTLLQQIGLEPLPVTALAHQLGWPFPLPLCVDDWTER